MLILGDKEVEDKTISLRSRKEGDKGSVSVLEFLESILEKIETKAL